MIVHFLLSSWLRTLTYLICPSITCPKVFTITEKIDKCILEIMKLGIWWSALLHLVQLRPRTGFHRYITDFMNDGCYYHLYLVTAMRKWSNGHRLALVDGSPTSMSSLAKYSQGLFFFSREYSSHSFLIGAATVVARAGMPDYLVRWNNGPVRRPYGICGIFRILVWELFRFCRLDTYGGG